MGRDTASSAEAGGWYSSAEVYQRQKRWAGALMGLNDDRQDDRPEDREDETDRAIKLAREHCIEAVEFLVHLMRLPQASGEDRSRAAISLLEVAGCL